MLGGTEDLRMFFRKTTVRLAPPMQAGSLLAVSRGGGSGSIWTGEAAMSFGTMKVGTDS